MTKVRGIKHKFNPCCSQIHHTYQAGINEVASLVETTLEFVRFLQSGPMSEHVVFSGYGSNLQLTTKSHFILKVYSRLEISISLVQFYTYSSQYFMASPGSQ